MLSLAHFKDMKINAVESEFDDDLPPMMSVQREGEEILLFSGGFCEDLHTYAGFAAYALEADRMTLLTDSWTTRGESGRSIYAEGKSLRQAFAEGHPDVVEALNAVTVSVTGRSRLECAQYHVANGQVIWEREWDAEVDPTKKDTEDAHRVGGRFHTLMESAMERARQIPQAPFVEEITKSMRAAGAVNRDIRIALDAIAVSNFPTHPHVEIAYVGARNPGELAAFQERLNYLVNG